MKQKVDSKTQSTSSSSSSSGNKKPKMTKKDYKNGVKNSQFISVIYGLTDSLRRGPKGVKVGSFRDRRVKEAKEPEQAKLAFAQAEFFYDCSGDWDSGSCNNEGGTHESAMWHFKWRARLRRYSAPNDVVDKLLIAPVGEWGYHAGRFLPVMRPSGLGNAALRVKVLDLAKSSVTDAKNNLVFH
jgi:hypothetical protein